MGPNGIFEVGLDGEIFFNLEKSLNPEIVANLHAAGTKALNELKELTKQAQENNYSPQQFITEAEKISPEVKKVLNTKAIKDFLSGPLATNLIAFLAFLSPFLMLYMAKEQNPTPVVNNYVTNNYYQQPAPEKKAEAEKRVIKNSNITPQKKKRKKKR